MLMKGSRPRQPRVAAGMPVKRRLDAPAARFTR
jgi:hypothetical protein